MRNVLTIGALAKAAGAKIETIRYYERVGLLPKPPRTDGNYRAYESEHLVRLAFVRRARELGFSLESIRTLSDLSDQKERRCEDVGVIARDHLAEVERKIADLSVLGRELRRLLRQCKRGTIADCRIIAALSPSQAGRVRRPLPR